MNLRYYLVNSRNINNKLSLIAKLFLAVIFIVIFEGALRKWVSNGLTYPIVALRDGIAVFGIVWSLSKSKMKAAPNQFNLLLLFTLILTLWGLLQVLLNQTSFFVFVLGLRFWLLYLWFAFIAGYLINEYDFEIICRYMILILILMTPLAVVQHFLPPSSFWNKQVEEGLIFTVSRDIVRTTGTFSFTMGYTLFLAFASPFVFLSLERNQKIWEARWMQVVSLVSAIIATIVSGSRGAIVFFAILFLIYSFSSARFAKGKDKTQSFVMIFFVIAILVISMSVFTRAITATQERFEGAHKVEKPMDRFIYSLFPDRDIDLLGNGLGSGSNFAGQVTMSDLNSYRPESENAKVLFEIGYLGVMVFVIKMVILYNALRQALITANRLGYVSTLLIWITLSMDLIFWPIIGQLTGNAMGYLLLGLGIAVLRFDKNRLKACR